MIMIIRKVLFVCCIALGFVGCDLVAQSFVPPDSVFGKFDIDGSAAFVIGPKAHAEDKAQPWVWYAPAVFSKDLPGKTQLWIFSQLVAQGVWVAGVDVGESYGAPIGTNVYDKFYEMVTHRFKLGPGEQVLLSSQPCFLAQSRGGLMAYAWSSKHSAQVKCIAGIYPVVNLKSWPDSHSPDQIPEAAGAYGLSIPEFLRQSESLSPISHLQPLAETKIPILHLHGSDDRAVPIDENSEILRQRYTELNGPMTLITVPGKGHEEADEFFKSGELLAFLLKQLRPSSVSGR
jgi:hypothetical protein